MSSRCLNAHLERPLEITPRATALVERDAGRTSNKRSIAATIEVEGLAKRFGSTHALAGIDLYAEEVR